MFPEDYFNNISLFAVYGSSNAYKLYNDLNSYRSNQKFYINNGQSFLEPTLNYENKQSFHIGINCQEENLNNNTCSITHKNINYSFIFDGFIENKDEIIKKIEDRGLILQNYGDAHIFSYLFLKAQGEVNEKINQLKTIMKGSYSFLIKYDDYIIAGTNNQIKKRFLVGESHTGTIIITNNHEYFFYFNLKLIKELCDGEIIIVYDNQIISNNIDNKFEQRCALNYIYKSNINSTMNNISLLDIKKMFARFLEKVNADIVTYYPGDSLTYAHEYANIKNMTFKEIAFLNNNHMTYIDQHIKDMRIIIIKENISQVSQIREHIENLYKRGAREVHLKVLSPMLNFECPFGMNNNNAFNMIFNETGIKEYLQVTSIEFLTTESFMLSIRTLDKTSKICLKCINK